MKNKKRKELTDQDKAILSEEFKDVEFDLEKLNKVIKKVAFKKGKNKKT